MAKKLSVTIELEMTVPDDWQIIETTDGIPRFGRCCASRR